MQARMERRLTVAKFLRIKQMPDSHARTSAFLPFGPAIAFSTSESDQEMKGRSGRGDL
jgi:hypothetical protein